MKLSKLYSLVYVFGGLLFFGCNSSEDPEPKFRLQSVGFEGILPNGLEFGNVDIRSSNGLTTSSQIEADGELEMAGAHILSIRNPENGLTLSVELPRVGFSEPFTVNEYSAEELKELFNEQYPYELVLSKLLEEKAKAKSDPTHNSITNISFQYSSIQEYYNYDHFNINPLDGGKVQVVDVIEGIEENILGQPVRKIEVIFDFDLTMEAAGSDVTPQSGQMKGTARFKYREDYYQGEFEN